MARSKSLKVGSQLTDNVKCSRMLIKKTSCDLPDVELFYHSDHVSEHFASQLAAANPSIVGRLPSNDLPSNGQPTSAPPSAAPATAKQQQFQRQLMSSIQRRLNKCRLDAKGNLDKLKWELENNLRDDLNRNSTHSLATGGLANGTDDRRADDRESSGDLPSDSSKMPANKSNVRDKHSSDKVNGNNQSYPTNQHRQPNGSPPDHTSTGVEAAGKTTNLNGHLNSHLNNHMNGQPNSHLNGGHVSGGPPNNPHSSNGTAPHSAPSKRLFIRNNSSAVTPLDDNWFFLNSNPNSNNHQPHFQASEHTNLDQPNQQPNASTVAASSTAPLCANEPASVELSGHLNVLCENKKFFFFNCVNWKRRFVVLQDHKLIIRDSQVRFWNVLFLWFTQYHWVLAQFEHFDLFEVRGALSLETNRECRLCVFKSSVLNLRFQDSKPSVEMLSNLTFYAFDSTLSKPSIPCFRF